MIKFFYISLSVLLINVSVFGQFGKNKVQYKNFTWYYIQTDHFDIYFTKHGSKLAEFTSKIAEEFLKSIQKNFDYKINNRISIIVYNSTNDFQETNITDSYISEGIEGFTELFKNRVVVQFMGSYKEFRHLIRHELTHAVINDMFFGGSYQNVISNNLSYEIPIWFNEGLAEYESLGWDIKEDMFIRDAAISEYLPDVDNLSGYLAYRGGQAVFYYIAKKYGKQKVGELVNNLKEQRNVDDAFKATLGISLKEFNKRWKRDIKKVFWPDVAIRKYPDDFAKRLTDPEEDDGTYNVSPALSPQGDKIAFISNRDTYFDVFIMNSLDGKIIKKLVEGNTTPDFEQLNVVTPGLCWSPDGEKIALSAKSNGYDVVYIINVKTDDRETLPINLEAIKSLSWSPDGKYLALVGQTASQSDIYIYNFKSKKLTNLTHDIFTDNDPSWSPDSKTIFFSSDRGKYTDPSAIPDTFKIYHYNYNYADIYSVDVNTQKITRITNMPLSSERYPICSADGKEILFVSDENGIDNIFRKKIELSKKEPHENVTQIKAVPVTNSIEGITELSTSKDTKKLTFTSLYEGTYNIFVMNNPFEAKVKGDTLVPTVYEQTLREKIENEKGNIRSEITAENQLPDSSKFGAVNFYSARRPDTARVYGDSIKIELGNYVFGTNKTITPDTSSLRDSLFTLADKLDSNGNYKVHPYKINFTPDLVYANAGYSTFFGLLGTTAISFSDILGNYRLVGITSLQIDLKDSDYGLAYYYLPARINYGIQGFHTARFVYLNRNGFYDLYRFRSYGFTGSMSYPLNKFYRLEGGLSWLNIRRDNLNDPYDPSDQASMVMPSLSFVHDDVLWGYTAPIEGTRYRLDLLANLPVVSKKSLTFYSFLWDYRHYVRFLDYYSLAFRFSGGYSGGENPQKFFIGGMNNWINRSFATGDIPLNTAADFVLLTPAFPLRGYDYAAEIGSKYTLMNFEFRFPLIRYLVAGPLPILFSNIWGTTFLDMGTAWNRNKELKLFGRDPAGNFVSQDLLTGTGFGARIFFAYFLLRFDVGWAYNFNHFSAPKFYFSLGADF